MTCKLYIGNIPNDTREEELEEKFRKYGRIDSIWLARNPPGFAFVTYQDERDAEDAQRDMDNQEFLGRRIRVEPSRERKDRDRGDRRDSRGGGRGGYSRGEYRVTVSGLSSRCSWQDLKDFLRRGGEVCYADVRNGEGIADFISKDEMERAIRKLDGTEFEGRKVYIDEEKGGGGRDRDRDRDRDRRRSRSPRRSRDRGRDEKRDEKRDDKGDDKEDRDEDRDPRDRSRDDADRRG